MYLVIGIGLVLLGVTSYLVRTKRKPAVDMREITMTAEGRRMYVQRIAMERICDGLLEAVINGEITDDEANAEMARLAKIYSHPELIPLIRKKKTPMLKAQLRNNKRRRAVYDKETPSLQVLEAKAKMIEPSKPQEVTLGSILRS